MRKSTIQTRLFVSFLALALFVACALSAAFYRYASNILTRRELEAFRETAGNLCVQTDAALRTLDDISINIGYSGLVRERLEEYFSAQNSGAKRFSGAERLSGAERFSGLAELFVSINGSNYSACQMFFYSQGRRVGVGLVSRDEPVELSALSWVEPTRALKGKKYVSPPYNTSFYLRTTSVSPWYISLYRAYFDRYGNHTGYLEVVQSYKTIFKSAISYAKRNPDADIYIFNENGALIFPAEQGGGGASSLGYYFELAEGLQKSGASVEAADPETGAAELAAVERSDYSGWTYVCARPKSAVLSPVREAGLLLFGMLAVIIPISVLLSYFAARRITRPLKRLVTTLHETRIETLGAAAFAETTHVNELDELNEAFARMSRDLKTSMNELLETRAQEQRSRSLALQSQINPHFYYNSLSSIMVLAENGESDGVVKMCKNLSGIMRYITDSSCATVTIAQELDYVEKYLYCMKVRYQSSLNYSIEVDETLQGLSAPRLIIQPLVENALKYGANCAPPWEIKIFGTRRDDYWTISVCDTGPGFTAEALRVTHERIKRCAETTGMPVVSINGMGLINVYSRWRLFAGADMIFEFANKSEKGGAVISIGKFTRGGAN